MPTAWSNSGSLASDRIRPHPPPPRQQQQNKSKGKGKAPTPEPPRSKAVRALEVQLDGARGSSGQAKDPKGGCFCQARKHALSGYVPMCRQCGLILCTLNPPHCACPHCASALLDGREREALVRRLEGELSERLAKEEAERQKAIEEARAAEGAFPALPVLHAQMQSQRAKAPRTPPPSTPATRTVLSLNSETKRVMVSSYSTPTAVRSRPASRGEDREEEEGRVPGPSGEVGYVKEPPDPGRPWRSVRAGDVRYVPVAGAGKRAQRKKGETSTG